MDIIDHSMDLH